MTHRIASVLQAASSAGRSNRRLPNRCAACTVASIKHRSRCDDGRRPALPGRQVRRGCGRMERTRTDCRRRREPPDECRNLQDGTRSIPRRFEVGRKRRRARAAPPPRARRQGPRARRSEEARESPESMEGRRRRRDGRLRRRRVAGARAVTDRRCTAATEAVGRAGPAQPAGRPRHGRRRGARPRSQQGGRALG